MTSDPIHLRSDSGREYTLLRQLDQGGFGAVFDAVDEGGDPVAVKVLMEPQSDDALRRFQGEVDILLGLDHPHIIQVLDYGVSDDGYPWYVMEKLEGSAALVVRRNRSWEEVANIIEEVALALAAYQEQGGIHRDIKLGNILIDTNGCAVLADFGVARCSVLDGRTMTRGPNGTFPYMAPEMASSQASDRSDIYALGIVLWELAHGQFHDSEDFGHPPEWTAGTGTAEQLYVAMVQRDPSRRPTAAQVRDWLKDTALHAVEPANNTTWLDALGKVGLVAGAIFLVGAGMKALAGR